MIRMIVATRLGGLPGNVRYPDTSFGFNTKQLNHQDKSTLGDISSLKQPLELLVSLSLPPNNTHNTHNTHNPNTEPSSMSNSNTELILEHWRIQFSQRNRKKADMTEKMLLERLKIGIRSLHALLSILPAFSFVRGPSLRFDEGRERPPCRVSKLSASNEHGGGRNSSSNNGATEGMRFEQRVGVPHSTHNNNGAYGVLRVDVIKSNPFSTPATSPAFTAECIDIPLSYGVLRIEVEYRQNIETTNIETPHIIHDYYVSAGGGGGGGGSSSSSNSSSSSSSSSSASSMPIPKKREERGGRARANSKPVAIPGAHRGRDGSSGSSGTGGGGGIRARSLTSGSIGIRPSSLGSSPLYTANSLTTGLTLLRQESGNNNSSNNNNTYNHQNHPHSNSLRHNQQYSVHPQSVPINIQKSGTSLLSMMIANGDRSAGPGTPPLHPARSPSISPHLRPSSLSPYTSSNMSNVTASNNNGISRTPFAGSSTVGGVGGVSPNASPNDYPSSYPTPPFLAGSAPRDSSNHPLASPHWSGLPSPMSLLASPPVLGLVGGGMSGNHYYGNNNGNTLHHHHHQQQHQQMINLALGENGGKGVTHLENGQPRTLSLQSYQANYQQQQQMQQMQLQMVQQQQQQQQQQRYTYGNSNATGGAGGAGGAGGGMGIARSISSNSLMNYMNGANTPIGSSPGTNLIYGSSPKTAASGWIEYTTTAGTAAPDSFSPWGKVLGVVAARTRAASKSATVAQKIGASFSTVDTSWLQEEEEEDEENIGSENTQSMEARNRGARPGPLAVDAPSGTDDMSRVGAFLQALDEHEERWNIMTEEHRRLQAHGHESFVATPPTLQEILTMARQQVVTSLKY
jgi:hypothetical protein